MDVNFSPDVPAWVCYLVVLFFGAMTGWREVIEKLGDPRGIWRHGATWALMTILAITPAVLFWILDRAGAVSDTSIVGAAIIGVAYTQILKGNSEYKAPGSTTPIWDFLSWWRDQIGHSLQESAVDNALAFDRAATEQMAQPPKFAEATKLAEMLSADPVKFAADLEAERTRLAAAVPPLDQDAVNFKLAEQVYREIRGSPKARELMVDHKLIDKKLIYKHFSAQWGRRLSAVAVLLVIGYFALGAKFPRSASDSVTPREWIERAYLINRLKKEHGSAPDLARVTGELMGHFSSDDQPKDSFWLTSLREPLRDPTITMPRVDAMIQVMLAARDRGRLRRESIANALLYALRNSNVDARRRIQGALVYLARDLQTPPPQDLIDWNPTEGDAVPQIEQRIDQWRAVWTAPVARVVTAAPK